MHFDNNVGKVITYQAYKMLLPNLAVSNMQIKTARYVGNYQYILWQNLGPYLQDITSQK